MTPRILGPGKGISLSRSSTPTRLIQGKGGEHTRILSIYRRRDRPWPFLEPRLDLSPPTGVRTVDAST
ncbi:Protein of unknown function [Cotesia congregata]|uniref:Uncharacterized protein n=1 Tax=Cotesia congregata TaxID=51543 RepID=A0A8J2HPN4_COTCN|nr:Protein of unknown function [Cotesia congregata]